MMNEKEKTRQQLMEELHALRLEIELIRQGDIQPDHPEEDLNEIRELFHTFTDNMMDAMIITDWEGNFLYANKAAFKLAGIPERTDTAGLNIFQFLHPDMIQTAKHDLSLVKKGTEAFIAEYRINTQDGSQRWVETLGKRITYLCKEANLINIRDVTERRLAEEALRESEQRYLSLFMNNHAAMLLIHPETAQIMEANPAACFFYGYSREELTAKKITDINILSTEQIREEMRKAQSRQNRYFLFKHRLAGGKVRDVEVYSGPIMVGGEDLLYSIIHDITDRISAQEALIKSEERFRTLIQNSSDIIVIMNEEGSFIYETSAVQSILGYEKGHLIGKTPADFIHPDDIERVLNDLGEVYSNTNPGTPTEFRFLKADGTWVYLEAIGKNLLDYPGINGMVITARDITSRKKAEQERLEMERRLLHAQKLESLGVMAGGIAHDFNNLLMAILGNLDLALLDMSPVSRSRTYIEHALSAVHKAADLTNQMLAYSGRGKFDLKAFDMSEMVEEMTHLLKASIAKTITLNLQMDRDLPPIVADPGQIQQIIMNLIVNASDAIADNPGMITITTGMQECDESYFLRCQFKEKPLPGMYVFFEVKDTGCGMDKRTREKLFDPFFTTKFTGRGLGMAAVLGIVEGHKGSITVESESGKGTTIRVLFPSTKEGEQLGQEKKSAATIPGETKKSPLPNEAVLIVDDEEMVLSVCRSMVEHLGYRVFTAVNGDEALEIFHTHKDEIGCVILDLTMPKKDGQATFEELRHISNDIKIIISSGFDEQEITGRFLGKELSGIIKKPYKFESLAKTLELVFKD
ncbi:MAG: PAS domain S-box protein [Deltaproteobacteria bacterium]|nr:PAS domain S-box protein [Deltaproteobacteria bacterium]